MGASDCCVIIGCNNRRNSESEPKICDHVYELQWHKAPVQRRRHWLKLIGRKDLVKLSDYTKVCSNHFVLGKPSKMYPDPTLYTKGYETRCATVKRTKLKKRQYRNDDLRSKRFSRKRNITWNTLCLKKRKKETKKEDRVIENIENDSHNLSKSGIIHKSDTKDISEEEGHVIKNDPRDNNTVQIDHMYAKTKEIEIIHEDIVLDHSDDDSHISNVLTTKEIIPKDNVKKNSNKKVELMHNIEKKSTNLVQEDQNAENISNVKLVQRPKVQVVKKDHKYSRIKQTGALQAKVLNSVDDEFLLNYISNSIEENIPIKEIRIVSEEVIQKRDLNNVSLNEKVQNDTIVENVFQGDHEYARTGQNIKEPVCQCTTNRCHLCVDRFQQLEEENLNLKRKLETLENELQVEKEKNKKVMYRIEQIKAEFS